MLRVLKLHKIGGMKSLFKDLNIPVTNFEKVDSIDDLKNLANNPNLQHQS